MYVYLLLNITPQNEEFHKIGITKRDIDKRIKELQTGNPSEIKLLREYKSKNYKKIESWLHRKYSTNKTETDNEWRVLTDEQVFNFLSDCKEIDDTINFLKENNEFYS